MTRWRAHTRTRRSSPSAIRTSGSDTRPRSAASTSSNGITRDASRRLMRRKPRSRSSQGSRPTQAMSSASDTSRPPQSAPRNCRGSSTTSEARLDTSPAPAPRRAPPATESAAPPGLLPLLPTRAALIEEPIAERSAPLRASATSSQTASHAPDQAQTRATAAAVPRLRTPADIHLAVPVRPAGLPRELWAPGAGGGGAYPAGAVILRLPTRAGAPGGWPHAGRRRCSAPPPRPSPAASSRSGPRCTGRPRAPTAGGPRRRRRWSG